ncbi:branched-chain amino acid ABC transporter permease [Halovenus sp. WSH3]|uniref:Branched-chain amino acid ABC transporter permease n=1 Tax=Halovenus carboxidivorans TaxID=2692199 RepID=A0A6B0T8A0_9EURY|nr:branched-chain amino acid ABC transporter permease [Halovenus carboxidivorans]MXR52446.1 branched-chain amino acid ABC transporter permease [Halovenus carboxidivorans]
MSADAAHQYEPDSWPVQYLQDHAIHIAVVLVFLAYPFAYDVLVDLFALTAEMILPEPDTMLMVFVLGLFAMSFDFVSGYTGYLSFGHAAFFGIGAYFVVLGYNGQLPIVPAEFPFLALLLLGAVVAALFALLVGLLAFRLSGVYFAMITLGITEIMYVISQHWDYLTPGNSDPATGTTAGGANLADFEPMIGIPFIDPLNANVHPGFGDTSILGIEFGDSVIVAYLLVGLLVLICYFLMQRIIHSPFGRVMIAIRENEERAKAIGYNVFYYKIGAFMIAAFFGAVAGALLIVIEGTASPDTTLFFLVTGFALVATIIGGLGTLAGPLFGYIFLESVNEFLTREASGGGLQPWLQEVLPESVLTATIGGITVDGAMDAFMTGHGEFYAGIIFVVFVLYVPVGMLGTLRLRLGSETVARSVSRRIGRLRADDTTGEVDTDPPAETETEAGADESD